MNGKAQTVTGPMILWRTRGRRWDYSFVVCPLLPVVTSLYDFYVQVFADAQPGDGPIHTGGWVYDDAAGRTAFVATTFYDERLADSTGRNVVHYMTWFEPPVLEDDRCCVADDWGQRVVSAVKPVWFEAFGADEPPGDELGEAVAEASMQLHDDKGTVVPLSIVIRNQVAVNRAVDSDGNSRDSGDLSGVRGGGGRVLVETDITKALERAIVEGEAYAVGANGPFASATAIWRGVRQGVGRWLEGEGGREKLAQDVARSFGAGLEDVFVKRRVLGLHRRVSMQLISGVPRRGFDALIGVLYPASLQVPTEQLTEWVATLVGADPGDLMVRNLVAALSKGRK